jgi:hypothetical protein
VRTYEALKGSITLKKHFEKKIVYPLCQLGEWVTLRKPMPGQVYRIKPLQMQRDFFAKFLRYIYNFTIN